MQKVEGNQPIDTKCKEHGPSFQENRNTRLKFSERIRVVANSFSIALKSITLVNLLSSS